MLEPPGGGSTLRLSSKVRRIELIPLLQLLVEGTHPHIQMNIEVDELDMFVAVHS